MAGCIEYRVELHVDFVIMSGDVLGLCRQNNTYKHVHSMELLHTQEHHSYETDHRPLFRPSIPPSLHPSPCPFASSHFSDQTGRLADGLAPRPISRGPKRATRRNEY